MGDKTEAFDIFQTPLSSHYPLPLMGLGFVFDFQMSSLTFVGLDHLFNFPAKIHPPPPPSVKEDLCK
jgi:hypothetical protein